MNENVIEATGLSISFDKTQVLKSVDFTLRAGDVHAIVGQNGAGKSTLVKILNGFYQPDSGQIKVGGKGVQFSSTLDSQKHGIAMVYQDLSLFPSMSVIDNIFMGKRSAGSPFVLPKKQAVEMTRKLMAMIGVDSDIDPQANVERLSVGQQQLVEIAKALAMESKVLILDEPTASLSNAEIEIFFKAIEKLKAQGISIIYITHYLKDIFQIGDHVSVLRDGYCVLSKPTAESSISELVEEMLGKTVEHPKSWRTPSESKETDQWTRPPLLEFKKVSTEKAKDISFKLLPGQIIGLAGLLGSGRTEILNAIFGLDSIHSGEFLCNGMPVDISSPQEAIEHGISMVPEDRREQGLVLDFSVENNVLLSIFSNLQKNVLLNKRRSQKIVDHFVNYLNVKTEGSQQMVRYLSGGNQQKVVIAKCLSSESKILLLDDPTFGIDIHSKYEIMKIIKTFADQGNGVIFVSSEYSEMAAFCDHTYIVNKGTIVDSLPNENLTEDELLRMVQ